MDIDKIYISKKQEFEALKNIDEELLGREELVRHRYNFNQMKDEIEIMEKYFKVVDFKDRVR